MAPADGDMESVPAVVSSTEDGTVSANVSLNKDDVVDINGIGAAELNEDVNLPLTADDTGSKMSRTVSRNTDAGAADAISTGILNASGLPGSGSITAGGEDNNANIRSRPGSGKSVGSVDVRKQRRIIAEDPEWNIPPIPNLTQLCVDHIVANFSETPIFDGLPHKSKAKVLAKLSVDVPITITAPLVHDENYWKRCCLSRWQNCDLSKHDHSWKQYYFEVNLEEHIESFVPNSSDRRSFFNILQLSQPFVRRLNIKQLLPPEPEEDDDGEVNIDHINIGFLFDHLPLVRELRVTYGVRHCGMNFEWSHFGMTKSDVSMLSKALAMNQTLTLLKLHRSMVDDDHIRFLVSHLLSNYTLTHLDLSHNKISDRGARAVAKLINSKNTLRIVNLCDNNIHVKGGIALGHALTNNTGLRKLNLRLNRLSDIGGKALCEGLSSNNSLVHLNLSGNRLGDDTAAELAKVLMNNTSLTSFDLTCNKFGINGGALLREGIETNSTVIEMDLRLAGIGQENEFCISEKLRANQEAR